MLLDMWPGSYHSNQPIRYFTLPLLVHAGAAKVHSCEHDEDACEALWGISVAEANWVPMQKAGTMQMMVRVVREETKGSRCRRVACEVLGKLVCHVNTGG